MDDFEKADMPESTVPPNQTMMCYYSGQIHIRNMLNNIQCELYPPEGKHEDKVHLGLACAAADRS